MRHSLSRSRHSWTSVPLVVAVLALTGPGPACQEDSSLSRKTNGDFRDVVVTNSGKEIRGRVVQRYAPKEVLLLRDGKRVRVPSKDVKSMTTVNDLLREFFERSVESKEQNHAWILAEWAESKGLHAMAQLQAMRVLAADPDHEKAHTLLGHKQGKEGWLWKRESTFLPKARFDEYTSEWGHPLLLSSEHFALRTNADLERAVNALLDLERLYVWWFETFGKALELEEVVEPLMNVQIHKSVDGFPAWTGEKLPYYWPQPNGDISHSYFEGDAGRPKMLFQLGTEQILYNALAHGISVNDVSTKERYAAWLEVGLGQWVEGLFSGPPGGAIAGTPTIDAEQARLVLQQRRLRLPNLLGVRFGMFHDVTDERPVYWAQSALFVAFLMDNSDYRSKLLELVRTTLAETKGSSSSVFDKVFDTRIEKLEAPWLQWLEQKTGVAPRRTR